MMNNRERLAEARAAFEQLKVEFQTTGVKVSVSSVAQRAKIDRKYLYGKINTPDEAVVKRWLELGEEIKSFRKSQAESRADESEEEVSVATKLHHSLIENYSLLGMVRELESSKDRLQLLLSDSQRKVDELKVKVQNYEAASLQLQNSSAVVVNLKSGAQLISPDAERHGDDQLSQKKAWVQALNQLRAALARPFKKALFITVGAPASGKSTWCRNFPGGKELSVLFDACNLTQSDRYEILDVARQYQDVKVVAVVFCTDLKDLEARNRKREEARRVPVSKLRTMHAALEFPSLVGSAEFFDEILMVRG